MKYGWWNASFFFILMKWAYANVNLLKKNRLSITQMIRFFLFSIVLGVEYEISIYPIIKTNNMGICG